MSSRMGATSYTYETERILSLAHTEGETSHRAVLELQNADGTLTDLDLKGYQSVISHGLLTPEGKEYSACAPLTVLGQRLDSAGGLLRTTFQLIGMPDKLREDKANDDYYHHWSSTKTPKNLISEIASGQPVSETLIEKQESGTSYVDLDGDNYHGGGQRLHISQTVTKLSFKLKRTGSPTGDVYFNIYDAGDYSTLVSKVLSDASLISTSVTWYEVIFNSPVVLDQDVWIACVNTGGSSGNYISVEYSTVDVKNYEWIVRIEPTGTPSAAWETSDQDLIYRYKYTFTGIEVYDHCESIEVVYDSEDSLIDSYCPADSFTIKEGEDRLAVIDKLLFYTSCQRIFKADGKIHIFVPVTSGTTYDSEYSLASGHPFFSKSIRNALVIPNKVIVRSLRDAENSYEGSATSAVSYALVPKNDYKRMSLESDDQAGDMAAAIISRLEINSQQGSASVPVNCGSELYDYIKVADEREGDSRTGNIGTITRIYKAYPGRPAEYNMNFSLGRVALKSVAGTRASTLASSGVLTRSTDGSIPWDELYGLLDDMTANLHDLNVAQGWTDGQTPADELIDNSLIGYLKNLIEDKSPQLGHDLDTNAHNISIPAGSVLWFVYTGLGMIMSLTQTYIKMQLELDMASHPIINVTDPTNNQDAATKKFVSDNAILKSLLTTEGDMIYATGSSIASRLPTGTDGKVLTSVAGIPEWVTPSPGSMFTTQSQPSRSLDTNYHNTSAKPIFVLCVLSISGAGEYANPYLVTDSSSTPSTVVSADSHKYADGQVYCQVFGIVEPNNYYRVVKGGNEAIYKWTEWS